MYHHWCVYPPYRFLSETYQDDKAGRTYLSSVAHDGFLYLGMTGNVFLLYYFQCINLVEACVSMVIYAAVGSYANWLHHAFHLKGHWIERFVYFHDLRALHYTHHQGTAKHNYGFLDFTADIAGQTLSKPDFSLSNEPQTLIGKGDEHVSTVNPGPMPTFQTHGLQECFFCQISFAIEGLVGLLGMIFGAVKESGKYKRNDDLVQPGTSNLSSATSTSDKKDIPSSFRSGGAIDDIKMNDDMSSSDSTTSDGRRHHHPSSWEDFFLFG
jgi:hypothetical protein